MSIGLQRKLPNNTLKANCLSLFQHSQQDLKDLQAYMCQYSHDVLTIDVPITKLHARFLLKYSKMGTGRVTKTMNYK
jgi:hypothetical protein